jgi:hypothetical protein
MRDRLTDLMTRAPDVTDPTSWRAALDDASAQLARLSVRRRVAGPFRVTDHDVRAALAETPDSTDLRPFTWSSRTARRPLGWAALRLLLRGDARSPSEAVRSRLAESRRLVTDGDACASRLDRWVTELSPAGLATVGAAVVTWVTRLWCALDWSALEAPVVGRDRWWDSPHSALLALRGRADVRTDRAALVVLSGPRRDSVRTELALLALVDALRSRGRDTPGRVVGWWPDSGRAVTLEPGPAVLTLASRAVADVLATPGPSSGRAA